MAHRSFGGDHLADVDLPIGLFTKEESVGERKGVSVLVEKEINSLMACVCVDSSSTTVPLMPHDMCSRRKALPDSTGECGPT